MSKITLDEAIKYMEEASEREKNERFSKFIEQSVELLKLFGSQELEVEPFIELFIDITDEYMKTKNAEFLKEMLNFLDLEDELKEAVE